MSKKLQAANPGMNGQGSLRIADRNLGVKAMLTMLLCHLRTLRSDNKGATAIEYGLIAALISLMLVAGAEMAGPALETLFNSIGTKLEGAAS